MAKPFLSPTFRPPTPQELNELFCVRMKSAPSSTSIRFPGGFSLSAKQGIDKGDADEILASLMTQANAALAPIGPLFIVIDVVGILIDIVQAIKPLPDPVKLAKLFPELVQRAAKLIGLLPVLTIPRLAKDLLTLVVNTLAAQIEEMKAIAAAEAHVLTAMSKAKQRGNSFLELQLNCATKNIEVAKTNRANARQGVQELIGLIGRILQLIGIDATAELDKLNIGGNDVAGIEEGMRQLRALIDKIPD